MRIAAHGWEAELLPALGGALGALRQDGRDVLRPARPETRDPLETACFPLVPYANRIAHGRFAFAGEMHQLALNFGTQPHSLHGFGWQAEWAVAEQGEGHAVLVHAHDGGAGWPWRYRAEQAVRLEPGRCRLSLVLTNAAAVPMPAGLGLHPYFRRETRTWLKARAGRLWLSDATLLPVQAVDPAALGDWAVGARVEGEGLIDNSYDGWDGEALVRQHEAAIRIEARGARAFHLYRPPYEEFFCLEPVTHLPDAINRGGMDVLPPGETLRLEMVFLV